MGTVEFGVGFIEGKLIYDGKVSLPIDYEGYARTVIAPGFSDAHAHPQVVDVGESRRYRDSYEWLSKRAIKVDERGIREDPEVSSRLALSTILISLFDGVTLMALTGSSQGNSIAMRELPIRPKVVLQPTVMDRPGWLSVEDYLIVLESYMKGDEDIRAGLFLHSLGLASVETVVNALKVARDKDVIMGVHLSEGVREALSMKRIAEEVGVEGKSRIVAVHCFTEPRDCRSFFRGVVSCPASNMYLYGRTLRSPENYDALGSDWPLVIGTIRTTVSLAYRLSGRRTPEVLERATLGGYRLYDVRWNGDVLLFDEELSKVLEGSVRPTFVFIDGKRAINEGELSNSYDYSWVSRYRDESVRLAFERYGVK